jgi:hypothetical protein
MTPLLGMRGLSAKLANREHSRQCPLQLHCLQKHKQQLQKLLLLIGKTRHGLGGRNSKPNGAKLAM